MSASETSGNESSRKKHKKKHHGSSSQPTGTSTPVPSRPMSPAPSSSAPAPTTSPRKSSIIKLNLNPSKLSEIQSAAPNPSHMSDGEGTAGEMSDGAGGHRKKSIKLRFGGAGSQNGSRAGSPAGGSRAGSPATGMQSMQIIYFPLSYPSSRPSVIVYIMLLRQVLLGNGTQSSGRCKCREQKMWGETHQPSQRKS